MNYVEEHVAWLREQGVEVRPEDEAQDRNGRLIAPVDPELLEGLPVGVAEWYSARLGGRVSARQVLGCMWCREYLFDAPDGDFSMYNGQFNVASLFAEFQDAGLFPLRPIPFSRDEGLAMVIETVGERAGWLYAYTSRGGARVFGPVAVSISQYLGAVRGLVEVGLLSVTGDPAWVAEETASSGPRPPDDTPGVLVGCDCVRMGDDQDEMRLLGDPLVASISEILPGFELVTMKSDLLG